MCDGADIAWAAGFLDGEGTFGITKNNLVYHNVYVSAVQLARGPLEELQRLFGGRIYGKYDTGFGRSQLYTYSATGPIAVRLASAVYPYLRVKKIEAGFILAYRELGLVPVGGRLTDELRTKRAALYSQFVEAKHVDNPRSA